MIKFVKTLRYDLRPEGLNTFDYIVDLLAQRMDPPSLEPARLRLSANTILHSPLRRVEECMQREANQIFVAMQQLREVPINLTAVVTEVDWEAQGSNLVRHAFADGFVEDILPASSAVLLREVQEVLRAVLAHKDESVCVVSHSFRLKLIEAFVKTAGEMQTNLNLLYEHFDPTIKTYEFGAGFELSHNEIARAVQ